jgi:hypothetical protein
MEKKFNIFSDDNTMKNDSLRQNTLNELQGIMKTNQLKYYLLFKLQENKLLQQDTAYQNAIKELSHEDKVI